MVTDQVIGEHLPLSLPSEGQRAGTSAAIAQHHGVASSPIMLALVWIPLSHYRLDETERTALKLVASMDLMNRI